MSINRVIITGRLTASPCIKYTTTNVEVLTISVAVERNYKSANGEYETDFFDVICWRQTAKFVANYFNKGDKIEIDGVLTNRKWVDKYNQNRTNMEILAQRIDFGGKTQRNNNPEYDATPLQTDNFQLSDDNDPF